MWVFDAVKSGLGAHRTRRTRLKRDAGGWGDRVPVVAALDIVAIFDATLEIATPFLW